MTSSPPRSPAPPASPHLSYDRGIDTGLHGTICLHDLQVRMRDGVHLSTNVYLPSPGDPDESGSPGEGRYNPFATPRPVILVRTPYDKHVAPPTEFARRGGYAVVVQDVRGRFASEGEWSMLVSDGEDGEDTLE